jgi:hypothetical protein
MVEPAPHVGQRADFRRDQPVVEDHPGKMHGYSATFRG